MQENAVLYDRGDLDVVVVERSTDGMHELCNDPAVQTSHECPVRVGMRDVAAPSAGWGLAPCDVWLLEKGLACPCHFPGVPGDKTVWRRPCVGTVLTCPWTDASRLGGFTTNPVLFRDAAQSCFLIVNILTEKGRVNLERTTGPEYCARHGVAHG